MVEPVSQPYTLPVIGWLRADYLDDNRKDDAPLFVLGEKDPSTALGVVYMPLAAHQANEGGASLQMRHLIRQRHAEWSDATFGNVGPVGPLKHLSKEALEAAAEPGDLSEWADMQFLLWDAQRRAGISDAEITAAMEEKLVVNMARQWPEPKNGEPRLHIKANQRQEPK
ncbi:DUF550 domain-containing protein [Citrobacter koseri]